MLHINGIRQYVFFYYWLLSFSMFSRLTLVVVCIRTWFLFYDCIIFHCVDNTTFCLPAVHVLIEIWIVSPFCQGIGDCAKLCCYKIQAYAFALTYAFISLRYIRTSRITWSYSNCLTSEELQACFPKQLNHFTLPPGEHTGSISPHLHHYLLLSIFFIMAILLGVK